MQERITEQDSVDNNAPRKRREELMYQNPSYLKIKIVKLCFLMIFIFECFLCWDWLIAPLMPLIKDIVANNGVPSFNASMPSDIAHPLNGISLGGMSMTSVMSLWVETIFRVGVFAVIFGLTGKLYKVVMRFIRT